MITLPTILVDFDGVMNNLIPHWCDWLNEEHKTTVTEKDITDWDMTQFFPMLSRTKIYEPLKSEEFWKQSYPMENALYYLEKLHDRGFEIYVCTSSWHNTIDYKFRLMCQKHFPFIDFKHFIVTYNKSMIYGDYLIDDKPENLISKYRDREHSILFTQYHNKNKECSHAVRCNGWKEVYQYIIKKEKE